MDNGVIEDYYHMTTIIYYMNWMKLTHLISKYPLNLRDIEELGQAVETIEEALKTIVDTWGPHLGKLVNMVRSNIGCALFTSNKI